MRFHSHVVAGILLISSSVALPSAVQASGSRLGPSFTAIGAPARGSAVAYDTVNNVYLVVSAYGTLHGRFLSADGDLIGSHFVILGGGPFTHYPQVEFSPDANGGQGGFLVSWHQSTGSGATPWVRMVY